MKTRELAKRLGVAEETIHDKVRRGELPTPQRIGPAWEFTHAEAMHAIDRIEKERAARARKHQYVPTSELSMKLAKTPETVRRMAERGELPPPTRIGSRLFFSRPKIKGWLFRRQRRAARLEDEARGTPPWKTPRL